MKRYTYSYDRGFSRFNIYFLSLKVIFANTHDFFAFMFSGGYQVIPALLNDMELVRTSSRFGAESCIPYPTSTLAELGCPLE